MPAYAVFDLETNGGPGASVLSASSLIFDEAGRLLDVFNRFYLPAEPLNRYLIRVHGLTLERLAALRRRLHATVSPWFIDDWPNLREFWERWNVEGVIIHNARFDMAFLPELAQWSVPCWCSMQGLTRFCALPGGRGGGFKWPKLGEAVAAVCSRLPPTPSVAQAEMALADAPAHVSLADCIELYRLSARILTHHPELARFKTLDIGFRPPPLPEGRRKRDFPEPREDAFTEEVLTLERRVRELVE